jgi:O-antigen/teichoic acid export membrane protein
MVKKAPKLSFHLDIKITTLILKECFPFAVLYFLMSMYNRVDSVMIERMLPDGKMQAGIYAQSFRILDAFSMFAILFPSLLLPMFSRLLANKEKVTPLIRLSSRIIFVFATSVALSCSTSSKTVIDILYSDCTHNSPEVFSILILSFIPISITYIFGTLLTANGNLKILNYIALSALLLNWLLNYLFIPVDKAVGAAWACLVTQSLVAIVQIIISYRTPHFNFQRPELSKYITFGIVSIFSVVAVHILPLGSIVKFIGLIVLIISAGFLSGILSIKQAIVFVRQQRWDF